MILALKMGPSRLKAKINSQLVTNKVVRHYQAKEP